jgi:tungstate transport system substrate-binding protein
MRRINRNLLPGIIAITLLAAGMLAGCGSGSGSRSFIVAASSDLQPSGILDAWMKDFRKESNAEVQLQTASDQDVFNMALHGECDAIITHVPSQEESMQKANYLQGGQEIMHDDYLLVGPPADPAGVKGSQNAVDALKKIGNNKATFIVRSDGSGISFAESDLWAATGIQDFGDWMIENNAGMEDTLRLASERGAYTLCDRSTYENVAGDLNLEVAFEDRKALENTYSAHEVGQMVYPDTNLQDGQKLLDYMASSKAQSHFNLGSWEAPSQSDEGNGG